MDRAAVFAQHRPRLYGIAYRMLGSRADAEDMLQEAYLRWHQADAERVRTPEAWLVTAVTHLCIDRLRAVRAEREAYVGPWLPEPLVEAPFAPPDAHAELASDLSVAFLVVLERLAPEERAALLLREVFECDYADLARILGKSEAACRQIVHRARERVREDRPRFEVSAEAHKRLVERFVEAALSDDQDTMLRLLAPEATWTSDGGGKRKAARKIVRNRERVTRFVLAIWRRYYQRAVPHPALINGEHGLVMTIDGVVISALSFDTDGVHIRAVYTVLNPDKLRGVAPPAPA
jgi:RNA polymerase sigma-70 factor (ECF subfamily)